MHLLVLTTQDRIIKTRNIAHEALVDLQFAKRNGDPCTRQGLRYAVRVPFHSPLHAPACTHGMGS
jgi:hypothetical protein